MNLLVTNTFCPQAYDVIRALRPHAERIVATVEGESRFQAARLSHGAYSRLVDKRHYIPSPIRDWWAGNIKNENTEREEAFIRALVRICEEEKIDVIYPSWDPHVYLLSKNLERFKSMGVVIPVPAYETVLTALDKYRTIQAAQEIGFPCPQTYLYNDQLDLKSIAEKEGFPLVIKPRFTSGSRGQAIVKNYNELLERLPKVVENHGDPMIQEYIPGVQVEHVQFVVDRRSQLRFAFHKKRHRRFRVTARFAAVSKSDLPDPFVPEMAKLINKVGLWGAIGIQVIHDPRDGIYKLLEINPRLPRQLWSITELGINEPWMCIRVARGESIECVKDYPQGVLFVCPVEDIELLVLQVLDKLVYQFRTGVQRRAPFDRFNPPPSVTKQIQSFMQTYLASQRKVFDPQFKYFFQDPLVSILWWLKVTTWMAGGLKQLGK